MTAPLKVLIVRYRIGGGDRYMAAYALDGHGGAIAIPGTTRVDYYPHANPIRRDFGDALHHVADLRHVRVDGPMPGLPAIAALYEKADPVGS